MSGKNIFGERLRALFSFSRSEKRGILYLLPLLAVAGVLIFFANRPRFEKSFLEQATETQYVRDKQGSASSAGHISEDSLGGVRDGADAQETELFYFDPNTVTLQELCRLGFSARTAAGIIKYRERGKRFELPEDFATCYGVSLDDYTRLEPYIKIGEKYRLRRAESGFGGRRAAEDSNKSIGNAVLSTFDPNLLDEEGFRNLGFSAAQAGVIVRYRESRGGFRTSDDFASCYVVSERDMERLGPYIKIGVPAAIVAQKVEINTADSSMLRSVSGIGEALVGRIIDYRTRLGGYYYAGQLMEIPGMSKENFERICEQIWVDSCKIQKIDVNFASHKNVVDVLGKHPYITTDGVGKLLKNRQLKGGWRSIEDMVGENILTKAQAEKLAPYLIFGQE